MVYSRGANIAAYRGVATHGGIAAEDPHRLTLMLLDGALARLAAARGAIENRMPAERTRLLHRAIEIVCELHSSLNLAAGGAVASNLSELYNYMELRLLKANLESNAEIIAEVSSLLQTIRDAWAAIPVSARTPAGV